MFEKLDRLAEVFLVIGLRFVRFAIVLIVVLDELIALIVGFLAVALLATGLDEAETFFTTFLAAGLLDDLWIVLSLMVGLAMDRTELDVRVVAFLATVFFETDFLATVFLAADFLGADFLAAGLDDFEARAEVEVRLAAELEVARAGTPKLENWPLLAVLFAIRNQYLFRML